MTIDPFDIEPPRVTREQIYQVFQLMEGRDSDKLSTVERLALYAARRKVEDRDRARKSDAAIYRANATKSLRNSPKRVSVEFNKTDLRHVNVKKAEATSVLSEYRCRDELTLVETFALLGSIMRLRETIYNQRKYAAAKEARLSGR